MWVCVNQAHRLLHHPTFRFRAPTKMVGLSGVEPEYQASEACALSNWTIGRKWYGSRDSNPDCRFRRPNSYPIERLPRVKLWQPVKDSNLRHLSQSQGSLPLNEPAVKTWSGVDESNVLMFLFGSATYFGSLHVSDVAL